jgi:peptidoglycan/LPS O-acetylase OafA/YrhL
MTANDFETRQAVLAEPSVGPDFRAAANRSSGAVRAFIRDRIWLPFRDTIQETYKKQSYPLGYSPGLDGLRGVMTIGTLTSHVHHPAIPGSVLFMDIFYVMSGYFITGLLIRDVRTYGRVRFAQFYRRRFARLVPPLAAMTLTLLLLGFLLRPNFAAVVKDASIGFFYVANWWRAFEWPGIHYMGHTWSLAIEEQFYLLWPVTFLLLYRWLGIGWRMVASTLALALAVWAWRSWLAWNGASPMRLYNGFDTRADALMIGCTLSIVLALVSLDDHPEFDRFLKKLAWPVAICGLTFTFFFIHWEERFYYYAGIVFLGAGLGVLLMLILLRPLDTVLHRVFERRALMFLGRIFYAMYVWHYFMFIMMKEAGLPTWTLVVLGYPLTIFAATLSYVFIERHFMRTKKVVPAAERVVDIQSKQLQPL